MKSFFVAMFLPLFATIEGRPQENPGIFDFCSAYASSYKYVYEKMKMTNLQADKIKTFCKYVILNN